VHTTTATLSFLLLQSTLSFHIYPSYTTTMLPLLPYHVAGPSDVAFMHATWETMERAFGFTPSAWQDDILCHILQVASFRHSIEVVPTFLCQPTGGAGKSLIRDIFASGRGGIAWCIRPLLALGADQESKFNKCSLSNDGKTFTIHLGEYHTKSQLLGIWHKLNKYTHQSKLAVVLLCFPQILCSSETIRTMFMHVVESSIMQLLCVDEAHLFVQFGLFFWEEFIQLKVLFIRKICCSMLHCILQRYLYYS
jgi:superfamily II DNA helicase RecQ